MEVGIGFKSEFKLFDGLEKIPEESWKELLEGGES